MDALGAFILFGGGLMFLLLIVAGVWAYFNQDVIRKLVSADGESGDGEGDDGEKPVKNFTVYRCHGANFASDFGKFDVACPSADLDYVWADQSSCDKAELIGLENSGAIACPAGYSYIEGPEETRQKCINGQKAWGYKCYQRRGYYNYNKTHDSVDYTKGIDCCFGTQPAGTKCSGRFCPGSVVCNNIYKRLCTKEAHQDKPACQKFCSASQSGFPSRIPQTAQIEASKDLGYRVVVNYE